MKKLLIKLIPKLYGFFLNLLALINPKKAATKAFYIFCTVRKGRILPHQLAFLKPAIGTKHEIAGHSIQTYHWSGNKETVLLIHGWESNSWRWHKLITKLQEAGYNIIAFDAPAHGYSSGKYLYVPLYAEILQPLIENYSPKYLIGHSVGGMTVIYNEHKNETPSVEKIITIGSPSEFHEIMTHFKNLLGLGTKIEKALENFILEKFGFKVRDFSSSKFVQTNTKKGLLFHDRLDTIAPYHASVQVHENWKNSEFISTEGLGHSMHQDEVNNQIIAFLKS
ncbi:alpha/beta hydrolase [uncultured Croceitalea sp.]|uniref:alpha/beta hydrolase n=1 Tax=uncultured Croceitalea sp. TaxID=1798908 RepID=UPI00374E67C3